MEFQSRDSEKVLLISSIELPFLADACTRLETMLPLFFHSENTNKKKWYRDLEWLLTEVIKWPIPFVDVRAILKRFFSNRRAKKTQPNSKKPAIIEGGFPFD
ncbi:MAG: hypothetical protein AB7P69_16220 [Candidatus Binatia bacterium]